ncbi:MAG: L-threonylcarbamoyladenylate synthase [Candidatus Hydrothermarchaeales archaeon]
MELLGTTIRDIRLAARVIKAGGVVVYPTDTLYGLGADALDEDAIRKVFELKKRPLSQPLPIAVADMKMLKDYAVVDEKSEAFIEKFLPGPLGVILKKRDNLPDVLTSGLDNVAVRIPDNPAALRLITCLEAPITTTSANLSGKAPPISVEEVLSQIRDVNLILDGGKLESRDPSTIVDLSGEPKVVRVGRVPVDVITMALEEVYG